MNQGYSPTRFIIPASKERHLPVPVMYLKRGGGGGGGGGGVPRRGELTPSKIIPTRATSHLGAHANDHFTVKPITNMCIHVVLSWKKTTCMYETTLYMPHVLGQPSTYHPMQVPMVNKYRVSPDSHLTTRSLCDIYLIVLCLFGQQNFPGSHRGSLTPSDIFQDFTNGYAV